MKDKPVFWKQANGELISVDNMDINHLRNVLKMIIKNSQKIQVLYFFSNLLKTNKNGTTT